MMSTAAEQVSRVLRRYPVLDGHNDLLWRARELVGYDFDRLDLEDPTVGPALGTHTDLPRLEAGGVGGQFWSVFVPQTLTGADAVTATLEQVDAAHEMVRRWPDRFALARTPDDVLAAWDRRAVASLLGAEGGHQIDGSLGVLRTLHHLGVRYLTLTHNSNIAWADSATDEPVLGGLSDFGHEVVREMNRLGMIVDLSHVSADVMRQALTTSDRPVLFSHSSARAICDHPRNVPDDVLAQLPLNGGVAMVTFVPRFVSPAVRAWDAELRVAAAVRGVTQDDPAAYEAFKADHTRRVPPPPCGLADVVAHVEHVREVAGVEHVGLGGDYDGVGWLPEGLEDVAGYPRLLEALAGRGWSEADLALLTSRNALRVLGDNPPLGLPR